MHTVISEPVLVANGYDTAKGTSFEEHPAFEASSIRHIGDWYYFVYSSLQGHELCYAVGKNPAGPFEYKGVIVSNGDLGLNGNTMPVAYWGNNHGGLERIGDKTYIFYHRQTHGTEYSRQGCAEEVHIQNDGTIPQVEITSCGLNGGPLEADGMYDAYIACNLMGKSITDSSYYSQSQGVTGHVVSRRPDEPGKLVVPKDTPYITEEDFPEGEHGLKSFICQMNEESVAGFKYFKFDKETIINLELRGTGEISVHFDNADTEPIGTVSANSSSWKMYDIKTKELEGVHGVYVKVKKGQIDFARIGFSK